MRQNLQIQFALSSVYRILTPCQPVLRLLCNKTHVALQAPEYQPVCHWCVWSGESLVPSPDLQFSRRMVPLDQRSGGRLGEGGLSDGQQVGQMFLCWQLSSAFLSSALPPPPPPPTPPSSLPFLADCFGNIVHDLLGLLQRYANHGLLCSKPERNDS